MKFLHCSAIATADDDGKRSMVLPNVAVVVVVVVAVAAVILVILVVTVIVVMVVNGHIEVATPITIEPSPVMLPSVASLSRTFRSKKVKFATVIIMVSCK